MAVFVYFVRPRFTLRTLLYGMPSHPSKSLVHTFIVPASTLFRSSFIELVMSLKYFHDQFSDLLENLATFSAPLIITVQKTRDITSNLRYDYVHFT